MTEKMNTDAGGTLSFARFLVSPLRTGEITVTATQTVTAGATTEAYRTGMTLHVTGERYHLDSSDVNSVFPPSGAQGEFTTTLPHVVLAKPTLPWQRSPGGAVLPARDATGAGDEVVAPWLAVLLFDELDPAPAPAAVTIGDLKPKGGTFFPARVTEIGEKDTDPVTVIDVPTELFNAIAPSLADLGWLAHGRQSSTTTAKATTPGGPAPGPDHAVVIGNRFPATDAICTAHLVSLEGYGPYLPTQEGLPGELPLGTSAVRLVTLHSWMFTAVDLRQTFQELLRDVDLDPLQLPPGPAPQTPADLAVRNAFDLGYTAMDHTLRDGATVSWYRGPLLPLGTPVTVAPAYADSDQLLRYDPSTGMFDVAYSAAWQLGRLLALHDNSFATALYRWKLAHTQQAAAALELQIIDQTLPAEAARNEGPADAEDELPRFLRAVFQTVGPAARRLAAPGDGED